MTDRTTEDLIQAKGQFKNSDSDAPEWVDEEFEERLREVKTIVDMKVLLDSAKERGLGDDRAVKTLEEQVAVLEDEVSYVDLPAEERLADEYGLREAALSLLSDDAVEELVDHLDAISKHENASEITGLRERELKRRYNRIKEILNGLGISPEALFSNATDSVELEAALAEADTAAGSDPLAEIDDTASENVRAAQLQDKKGELEQQIRNADSNLVTVQLQDDLETVEAELADLEGE